MENEPVSEGAQGLCEEIRYANMQMALLLDGLLKPNAAGLAVTVSDVQALMRVKALLPKMAHIVDFLGCIGIDLVSDPSRVCGFFFDISRLDLTREEGE
jgi:hypothetical protein